MSKIKLAAAAILMVLGFAAVWMLPLVPVSENKIIVRIPTEMRTGREITGLLSSQGVLRYPKLFRGLMRFGRWDKKIQRGTYEFATPESWPRIFKKLTKGDTYTIKITIPEGWRATEIAQRLEAEKITDAKGFLEIVERNQWEGYLFPSTYWLEPFSPPGEIAITMKQAFNDMWREFEGRWAPIQLSSHQAITLASIVEREATISAEMPIIASVYLNRLKKRMRLEADPTVQYAFGYWKERMLFKDLEIKSPYNTYRNFGLPPGPICSPGREAIAAVYSPQSTRFLYFVAQGGGAHTFSEKIADHNRAREKMIKDRREARRKKRLQ